MSTEEWERHNEAFQYEPPDDPPELWDQEDYTELYDRVIGRNGLPWSCDMCSKPFRSLSRARRHVERQHSEYLIRQAESKK